MMGGVGLEERNVHIVSIRKFPRLNLENMEMALTHDCDF